MNFYLFEVKTIILTVLSTRGIYEIVSCRLLNVLESLRLDAAAKWIAQNMIL